jgi:hypothetical protein
MPIESLWSEPSLPATTFHDPGAPAAPAQARVERNGGQTTIVLDPAPVAHRLAEGPWRLAVWRLAPSSDPVLVVPIDQSAIKKTPHRIEDMAGASHYRLALLDPLGRWSKTVDATSG